MSRLLVCVLSLALLAAAPVAKGSGAKLCVLTPADFRNAGIAAEKPHVNLDDENSAYCTYRGISGAKGGVELDVFYSAGASASDVDGVWKTVLASDPGANYRQEGIKGAETSVYSLSIPQAGYPNFAANAVRRGDLIFTISIPASSKAKEQLEKLSVLVLERLR